MTLRPVLALLATLPFASHAATLRAFTTLADPAVRLSDLFDGVAQDRVIGPAPEPGGRIVVEAAQLAAIARQFGVDWRPASTADRAALERPGRLFPREEALDALRAALRTSGVSEMAELEMPAFVPPMVPAGARAVPEVAQLEYDAVTGRFTAMLSVTAPGMAPTHTRLSGRVQEMVDAAIATRRLMPGDVVAAADVRPGRLRSSAVRTDMALVPAQAVGLAVRRPVAAGAPFPMADLGRPVAVPKGMAVQMQLDSPGLSLTAQGMAMEPGALGERIHVLNAASRAVVEAEVTGPGQVRVAGGTAATLPPGAVVPLRLAAR